MQSSLRLTGLRRSCGSGSPADVHIRRCSLVGALIICWPRSLRAPTRIGMRLTGGVFGQCAAGLFSRSSVHRGRFFAFGAAPPPSSHFRISVVVVQLARLRSVSHGLNEANRPDAVWIEGTAGVGGGWDWTEQSNLSVQLGGICNWSASARLGDSGPDSTWYDGTILALACFARLYSDDRHGTLDSSPVKRRPLSVPASGSSRRGHSSVRLSLNCQRCRHRAGMRSGGIALSVRPARFRGRPRRAAICPQASLPSSSTPQGQRGSRSWMLPSYRPKLRDSRR